MKKLLSLLLSILLVAGLAVTFTSCGNSNDGESVDPITYTFKLVKDDDGNKSYTLTSFALSEEAKEFVDEEDWAGLAELFTEKLPAEVKGDVTTYTEESARVLVIPSVWGKDNIPVTKVAEGAISNQAFIKELVVPSSIEEIELGAFSGLVNLEKITLPFIGKKIGAKNSEKLFGYIFGTIGSDKLTSVTQTYNDGSSENTSAFYIPSNLKTVVVTGDVKVTETTYKYDINEDNEHIVNPDGAYEITTVSYDESAVQPYAFHSVAMLETIVFEGDITAIPDYAFYGCKFKTLDFTNSTIVTIGKYAYANCTSLQSVKFGNVTTIKEGAFSGCSSLCKTFETTVIENRLDLSLVTTLGKNAFAGCSSLDKERIDLHADVTEEVRDAAFGADLFAEDEE